VHGWLVLVGIGGTLFVVPAIAWTVWLLGAAAVSGITLAALWWGRRRRRR